MNIRPVHRAKGAPAGLARFGADRSGNVAVMFAMIAVVLMLAIGAAVDISRWLHARDQTIAAMDAAVLAGGRSLQVNSVDTAAAVAAARNFYTQNVSNRLPVTDDTVTFAVADGGKAMTATGSAYIKTPFLQFINIDKLPLLNVTEARAERKIGNKEVSVMLDITGSMQGQKLTDLKAAATDLINIMLPAGETSHSAKVALVPFSEDIRLPTSSALNLARGSGLPDKKTITSGYGWFQQSTDYYLSDCVVERTGSDKYTDAAPGSGKYVMGHYTQNYTSSGWGWNTQRKGVCTVPSGSEVMPLSSDATALKIQDHRPVRLGRNCRPSGNRMGLVHAIAQLGLAVVVG